MVSVLDLCCYHDISCVPCSSNLYVWCELGSMSMAILGGGMKLKSKVILTNFLYIFLSKRQKIVLALKKLGIFS
jgi:hypothetical protein